MEDYINVFTYTLRSQYTVYNMLSLEIKYVISDIAGCIQFCTCEHINYIPLMSQVNPIIKSH